MMDAWDLVFLLLLVATPLYWLLDPFIWFEEWKYKPFLLPLLWFILRWPLRSLLNASEGHWEKSLFKKLTVATLSPFLMLLGFEFILAKIGFTAPLKPLVIVGEKSQVQYSDNLTCPDLELLYRFNPGVMYHGRRVNSMGFLDREVDPVKKKGTCRVICMGDSCTGQGIPPYSGMLHKLLLENPITKEPWEAFNMAVHGYSSTQGLKLFQLRTKHMQPDVVSLYYGWNDHWRSELPDAYRMATLVQNGWSAYVTNKLQSKLFYQFLVKSFKSVEYQQEFDSQKFVLRVSANEYRNNLTTLVEEIRSIGALPVLITAPRNKTLSPHLVTHEQTDTIKDAMERHERYNDICRQVASDSAVPLLDLAKIFVDENLYDFFTKDGIHLTRQGREYIADNLYVVIKSNYSSINRL